jgi:S1-C subfamily serine protease
MKSNRECAVFLFALGLICSGRSSSAQDSTPSPETPTSTSWALDAAGPAQRKAIANVYQIRCAATNIRGSGFLIDAGVIVTNTHVIHGCDADEIVAASATGKEVHFKNIISDSDRDLALLVPTEKLTGGLTLGSDSKLQLGQAVSAWGYPAIYDGSSPLLSVGYVAGFHAVHPVPNKTVRHIVVNGAYNPGNSGGPIFLTGSDEVIGIVVWKAQLVSDTALTVAHGLEHPRGGIGGTFSRIMPDGTTVGVSNEEAIGEVIEEFYNAVQVMIGEAISVSELKAFLNENLGQLK